MQYVASALSFAAAAVAIIAGARDGQLTATSWAALVVAVGSLIASLVITRRTQRELAERRAREQRIQTAANREAAAAIAQLEDVLNYARFAAGLPERRLERAPLDTFASPEGRRAAGLALPDPAPLDRRPVGEAGAARHRPALTRPADRRGVRCRLRPARPGGHEVRRRARDGACEGISELTGHPFAAHLHGLVALVDRRMVIEESQYASVALINAHAGSTEEYRSFVATLVRVDRLNGSA